MIFDQELIDLSASNYIADLKLRRCFTHCIRHHARGRLRDSSESSKSLCETGKRSTFRMFPTSKVFSWPFL